MKYFFLYVDPGSGSYLVQVIIAAILGGVFYIKGIWIKIKLLFGRKKQEPQPDNPDEHDG